MTEAPVPIKHTRRVGRPSLVDREQIAQAASELSLSDLTMRAVADKLGVSVTSLYYHVRDRDELRSLAAERAAAKHPMPVATGQHWVAWLAEWAEYSRAAFVAEPGLLEHFLNGLIDLGTMLKHMDIIVSVMEEQGFSSTEAVEAYSLVSSCAVGVAVGQIRQANLMAEGFWEETLEAARPSRRMKRLARVQAQGPPSFRDQLCTVLIGIAIRRGGSADEVIKEIGL